MKIVWESLYLISVVCYFYSSSPVGVWCIVINPFVCVCMSVCLSARISLEPLDQLARHFVRRYTMPVVRSSSGGIALRYVLPFLWMTSRSAVMGARPARVGSTQRRRSIMCTTGAEWVWCQYECLFIYAPVLSPVVSECAHTAKAGPPANVGQCCVVTK